ncbi:hypothetical protein V8E36_004377 [Tilletia maclaganii]
MGSKTHLYTSGSTTSGGGAGTQAASLTASSGSGSGSAPATAIAGGGEAHPLSKAEGNHTTSAPGGPSSTQAQISSFTTSSSKPSQTLSASAPPTSSSTPPAGAPTKTPHQAKRRKVGTACIYCRRSHMTCDEGRPCQRCIKRDIGHLCHDEATSSQRHSTTAPTAAAAAAAPAVTPAPVAVKAEAGLDLGNEGLGAGVGNAQSGAGAGLMGDDAASGSGAVVGGQVGPTFGEAGMAPLSAVQLHPQSQTGLDEASSQQQQLQLQQQQPQLQPQAGPSAPSLSSPSLVTFAAQQQLNRALPAGFGSKAERFLITAADQTDGTRDERLRKVIHAKYDAGLLKPYNYVNGYSRLNRWMEKNVSPQSRRRILKPLSVFRPAFRAIAQSLTNVDLLIIEEHFERLLLDYDRVFSTQGIPACLWRRTGEIYKGNKEFANLIGVNIDSLRDGRLCIYELMAEESAVNYWEKYGAVSFDPGQKAVLTSCILRVRPHSANSSGASSSGSSSSSLNVASGSGATGTGGGAGAASNVLIPCCFSFTIRRDQWNIPICIVGNFLMIDPS